ncbi:unnamed protein product [Effrenium voratum]|uniref:Uncharacterized protein n=1 Tax=Effrenium voratum TaxID=2562239 RepID=A0AA36N027_9DINO|nr:unnamed protein product [Effrenium voratum]CAJ1432306.1 unnamed protein product [Effrenium voratum]
MELALAVLGEESGSLLAQVWGFLGAWELLRLGRASAELWGRALEALPRRLPRPSPLPLLNLQERGAALRRLPVLEGAFLFENFSAWDPASLQVGAERAPAFGGASGSGGGGRWRLGPGTEQPPSLAREANGDPEALGHWCVRMANEDPLTDLGPSGLVFTLGWARPREVSYRCKAEAAKAFRAGAVLALAQGLGNDKGPERPAVLMSFVRDGNSREVLGARNSWTEPLGAWEDGQWLALALRLDWASKTLRLRLGGGEEKTLPFADEKCEAVRYLVLYNHTGDFVAFFTDLLIT